MKRRAHPKIEIPTTASALGGLSAAEADQRLGRYGPNELTRGVHGVAWRILVKQFRSALIYLLVVAAILSLLLRDYTDAGVIAIILVINAGLGFYEEYGSQKAVTKLQGLLSRRAEVVRDGQQLVIDERLVVPGDLVVLKDGDIAPADIKLTVADGLSADESQLTGESAPVAKVVGQMVYAGSTVGEGEGRGVVVATGLATEIGKIAHLTTGAKRVTQYAQSLASFSSFLMKLTLFSLTLVLVLKIIIVGGGLTHLPTLALFIVALSITVVPEALPVIATVTLSRGAIKLAKQHVVTRTLSAVEDLGNINLLCTDKTGTLTENRQTVKQLIATDRELFHLLAFASIDETMRHGKPSLSSLDEALLRFTPEEVKFRARGMRRLAELPFDPPARRRRVVISDGHDTYLVVIGSVETLLELTKPVHRARYLEQIKTDGAEGLRHLGLAYRRVDYRPGFDMVTHEKELKFLGFVSLEDPLRPTAKHTIELAGRLGVAIKILSGDSVEVTAYVAGQVGLLNPGDSVYSGDQLDPLSDEEVTTLALRYNAFARLSPEQKYRLIKLLKHSDYVVGYQGDGINDAPALKLADVAIAVNTATDVAKESADIILLHSDLGVIINGIHYGRAIFANINKYIRYTMIGNFGNLFALSTLYLLTVTLPLLPVQLLLTSLLTDLPLVNIATDNVRPEELARPSHYNAHSLMFISMVLGSVTALFEIMFFALTARGASADQATSLFLFLTILGLVVVLSVRNKDHFWRAPKLPLSLAEAFAVVTLLSVAAIYLGYTQRLFDFVPLPLNTVALITLMCAAYVIVLDVVKVWFFRVTTAL